jgi:spore germination protein YaaH
MTEISNKSYVETAHGAGLLVWGVLNDFDGQVNSSESTLAALSSEAAREKMIRTSVDAILDVNADGICLDIEKISDECAPYFLEFVREMSAECRKNDLYLSVCDYVPRYTKSLNRKEQARVCDYVICMCYDEHINGSEEAGSVASLPFVESGIRDTLLEVPAEQTVIAIPFFTRLWKTVSPGIPTASAMGMLEAEKWIRSNNLSTEWDDVCAQEYVEMNSGNTRYQMWLENNASLEEKLKLIRAADCAGVAEWKLGLEKADVWDLIAEYIVD